MKDIFEFLLGGPVGMQNAVFGMVLALISILLWRSLKAADDDDDNDFSFSGLVTHPDGSIDKPAAIAFGAFGVTSFVVMFQAFKGTLTDLTFGAYLAAWVAPTLVRLYKTGVESIEKKDGAP